MADVNAHRYFYASTNLNPFTATKRYLNLHASANLYPYPASPTDSYT
jgi:hypothetical protein